MGLVKLLFGERKPENEGFRNIYKTMFIHTNSAVIEEVGSVTVTYDLDSEFFINPENSITYMVGQPKNIKISMLECKELEKYFEEQITGSQRIFAYSVCRDGTEILTGNLGIEYLTDIFGRVTIRIPDEMWTDDGIILRNIKIRDINKVLGNHKNYVGDLELIEDLRLAELLALRYRVLNNYGVKI